jgi:hypothetical protein
MNEQNKTAPAVGEVLVPTPGPWQWASNWHCPGNLKGASIWYHYESGINPRIGDVSATSPGSQEICVANARLIVASCNSYQKHFSADPVTAAESDELGKTLAENAAIRALVAELAEGLSGMTGDGICSAEGGGFFIPRYDMDGEYLGEENLDPQAVAYGLFQQAQELLTKAREVLK